MIDIYGKVDIIKIKKNSYQESSYENKDKIKCGDSESEVATTLTIGEDEKSEADS